MTGLDFLGVFHVGLILSSMMLVQTKIMSSDSSPTRSHFFEYAGIVSMHKSPSGASLNLKGRRLTTVLL